jgi:hypothetical protein
MNALRGHTFRKLDTTWRQHCAAEAARLNKLAKAKEKL